MALGLKAIPIEVGWDLVMWKPILEQSEPKGALRPSEVHTEAFVVDDSSLLEGDSDSVMVETGSEPISDQSEFRTRPQLVPKIGDARIEPSPMFEEDVDDSFDSVADFEKDEEVEIPILVVQPKTIQVQTSGEGQKRKESKCLWGEHIFHLFANLGLCKLKPPRLPNNPDLLHLKPLPNEPENPTD